MPTVHATAPGEKRVLIGAAAAGDALIAALDTAHSEGFALRLYRTPFAADTSVNVSAELLDAMGWVQAHAEGRGLQCWWRIDYVRRDWAEATFVDADLKAEWARIAAPAVVDTPDLSLFDQDGAHQ